MDIRPIQPSFKIRIHNIGKVHVEKLKKAGVVTPDGSNDYIDIERCVAYPVTYEEQSTLLNTLSFTVDKYADLLLYYFHIGQAIQFYGGYYSGNSSGMRHVFSGTVTRVKTMFTDSGHVSFTVECMNYGFTKFGKDFKNFVYPDKRSSRKFATGDTISLAEIVRGIAKDNNFEIGEIDLSSSARSVNFSKINIRYQKNMSDWKFLNSLAQDFGCTIWISNEDGVEKLNFMSQEKAFKRQSRIQFLYPIYGITNKSLKYDAKIKSSEMQRFSNSDYDRPRILRDVTVDEDVSQANAVTRSAMYFDKTTGEYKDAVSQITVDKDGNRHITFYELNEQRVAYVNKMYPQIAEKIRNSSPTSLEWGDDPTNPNYACYYYTATKIYDENTQVFDKAFYGITVSAKCNQDLNIHCNMSYKIRGILSYHSKNLVTSFFLRGLKQVWDSDGNWTELDFIR